MIGKKLAAGIALAMMIAAPASADWWASDRGGSAPTSSSVVHAKKAGPAKKSEAPRRKPLPEPADFALFAAGVIGLLIGRHGSRIRRRRD